jgi:hypothetical protein
MLAALLLRDKSLATSAGTTNYLDQMRDPAMSLSAQLIEGARLRIYEMGRLLLPGMYKSYARQGEWLNVNLVVYLPVFAAVVVGWCKLVRERCDVLAWTFPFYLALHIIWPFDQATRFFTPLMPLFLVCLWFALNGLGRYRLHLLGGLTAAHVAVAVGCWCFDSLPHARATESRWPAVRELATLIQDDPAPVEVADMLDDTGLLLQYTLDRPVHLFHPGETPSRATGWLLLDPLIAPPEEFVVAKSLEGFRLCRRKPHREVEESAPFENER